jgi:hypothetical protein
MGSSRHVSVLSKNNKTQFTFQSIDPNSVYRPFPGIANPIAGVLETPETLAIQRVLDRQCRDSPTDAQGSSPSCAHVATASSSTFSSLPEHCQFATLPATIRLFNDLRKYGVISGGDQVPCTGRVRAVVQIRVAARLQNSPVA